MEKMVPMDYQEKLGHLVNEDLLESEVLLDHLAQMVR